MVDNTKLELARQMLEQATASLASAKQFLSEATGTSFSSDVRAKAAHLPETQEGGNVIEGIFDGRQMIDSEGKKYPVPENYASKSKLVEGDHLKLTIAPDGVYLYKQIGPIERKHLLGTLVLEGDQYRVIAENKSYSVLTASVTYYKLSEGDKVTVTVPAGSDSAWAAIESAVMA
jgi:hypothetical protein